MKRKTRMMSFVAGFVILTQLIEAEPSSRLTPETRAWINLDEGLYSGRAGKRTSAVHALGLLPNNSRARNIAEDALDDRSPKVRAAAAEALGSMQAVSSTSRLKAALKDKEPAVVIAASHALFVLGDRKDAFEIDYELLVGEQKATDGFVKSQIDELKDFKQVAMITLEAVTGFLLPFGGAAFDIYQRVDQDDSTPIRVAATKELARDPDPKIHLALAKACSNKNWRIRAAAVAAAAETNDVGLLNAVTPALDDKKDVVRYEASGAVLRLTARSTSGAAVPTK